MNATPETYVGAPEAEPSIEAVPHTPILISEQEVALSTAVAVRARPTTTHWWTEATSVVAAAMHRVFAASASDARPPRRHYPKRYAYLEHACLGREMDRL